MSDVVLAICRPIYEYTEPSSERCLRHLPLKKLNLKGIHMFDVVGKEVAKARNMLTAEVLKTPEITHILWVDSDATFLPDAVERLLACNVPVVGALSFSRHVPYHPIIGRKQSSWIERGSPYGWIYHYPPETLFQCDVTGAHLLLVRREVFEAISANYGEGHWWDPIGELSEDFSFCERLHEVGIPLHVHTGIKTGHIGKVTIDEELANRIRPFEWEPWLPNLEEEEIASGEPRASIVIPTYNQETRFLRAAILSAAHQSVMTEVIVVDDGSSPPVDLAQVFPAPKRVPRNVRLIRHERNRGVAAALNTGIEHMQTDWFAWLSSDDYFLPRKTEVQLGVMLQSQMKACYSRYQLYSRDNEWAHYTEILGWRTIPEQMSYLACVCAIYGCTVMLHRSIFDEVGRFDETIRYGQDWEFFCRVGEKYLFYPVNEILCSRRELATNLTAGIERDQEKKKLRDAEDRLIRERYAKWAE